MLNDYIKDFNPAEFVKSVQKIKGISHEEALRYMRERVPKEGYFQRKVIDGLKRKYPSAYVVKIAQGAFSNSGIPDIMCIYKGHYFAFEVKRPVFGKVSKLQEMTMRQISKAGGTAIVVSYPEEAFKAIDGYDEEQIYKNQHK